MNREKAKSIIESLVERYAEHQQDYHRPDYNEQKTRQDFINPFFKALGWDIDNEKGDSEAYREVIYEDKVKVKGKAKAPDYGFRLSGSGNKRLFYLEAKKPSIKIRVHSDSAYQLRRYGSSAQVPVSVLTNFEDFIIYDCTRVPRVDDSATVARLKHIHFKDYVAEFDFIYDTFSHEAVTRGRFDKFVQGGAAKRGTDTLDKRFVQSLDEWRKYLATNIAQHNRKLNDDELNYAVQQTLDRLIFLRFCEDRSVEPYAQMQKVVAKGDAYKGLLHLFKEADAKYNSGLFDFEKDTITPHLKMDPKVVRNVINEMYYPLCNFEFSVMPVEILGNAYEQFLGKVIRILPSRAVRIEEKPEVRKAGGVYYTPQYIVEYIVKNTVGKLIEGKSPKEIEKIKIVDPACGSGSFLLGAFDYLLRYHTDWYHRNGFTARKGKENPFTPQGTLSTHEKKRILRSNIYGVDLDANAVEVSKLSLLLKCMEGETEASMNQQMSLYHERVLPNLDDNIKDGNSLIDTDFYDTEIDLGYEKKIKPFSWQKAFPEVFKQGGFDAVVGNPPYSLIGADRKEEQKYFTAGNYELTAFKINTYILFIEKGLKLLKPTQAKLGFIIPKSLVFNTYFDVTRQKLLKEYSITEVVDIREKVFADAEVGDSLLIFAERGSTPLSNILAYYKVTNVFPTFEVLNSFNTPQKILLNEFNAKFFPSGLKVKIDTKPLDFYCHVYNGLNPGNVRHILFSTEKKNSCYKKLVLGRDIQRYELDWSGTWVNYDLSLKDKLKPSDVKSKIGMTAQTHVDFALRNEEIFLGEKICVRKTADHIIATIDNKEYYYDSLSHGIKLRKGIQISLNFILGLLNSKVLNYLHEGLSDNKDKVFAKVLGINLSRLPFPIINLKDKKEKSKHDEIIKHVDLLLALNEELKEAKLPTRQEQIKQRIAHSEDRINQLVYELYELTEDEIKIIEESIKV